MRLNEAKPIFCIVTSREVTSSQFSKLIFGNKIIIDNFESWAINEDHYSIHMNGSYFISINIPVKISNPQVTEIQARINGQSRLRMAADTTQDANQSRLISNSATFNLNIGDKVEIYFKGKLAHVSNQSVINIFFIN